jgi:hypothetical protein
MKNRRVRKSRTLRYLLEPSEYRQGNWYRAAAGVRKLATQSLSTEHKGRTLMRSLSLILVVFLISARAQNKTAQPFVLDQAKPYVYIAFDHSGRRKPLGPGESKQGFWLRFVNNCRVPVTIGTFGTGTGDPGIGVLDEVVPIPTTGFGGIPEAPETGPSKPTASPPEGYYAEVHSSMTVHPGENVLFSVPSDHLSPSWYLRVRFTLDVPRAKVVDRPYNQPYSYADFRWEQLPDEVRHPKK